jgi:hypothetical protein
MFRFFLVAIYMMTLATETIDGKFPSIVSVASVII